MKKVALETAFDSEKLNALRLYWERKGVILEQEIDNFLEKSYQKVVPASIKDFISVRKI